jgi:hypothetical protein
MEKANAFQTFRSFYGVHNLDGVDIAIYQFGFTAELFVFTIFRFSVLKYFE